MQRTLFSIILTYWFTKCMVLQGNIAIIQSACLIAYTLASFTPPNIFRD